MRRARPFTWDLARTDAGLVISDDGMTVSWPTGVGGEKLHAATTARLDRGIVRWDFVIEDTGGATVSVGVGNQLEVRYDAATQRYITGVMFASFIPRREPTTVTLVLDLERLEQITIIDGVRRCSPLPAACVFIPYVTLHAPGQRVRIAKIDGRVPRLPRCFAGLLRSLHG